VVPIKELGDFKKLGVCFLLFFLRENRRIAVWNEINLMGQCGIAYEKFLFSDVQKTLCSSFQYFYFP